MARALYNDDWLGASFTANRVESFNDFQAAGNERLGLLRTTGDFAVGDELFQGVAHTFRFTAMTLLALRTVNVPDGLGEIGIGWLRAGAVIEGLAPPAFGAVEAWYHAICHTFLTVIDEYFDGVGHRMSYPLEFATLASAVYVDQDMGHGPTWPGNDIAAVVGEVARCLANGKVYVRTAGTPDHWVYVAATLPDRRVFGWADPAEDFRPQYDGDAHGDYVTSNMFTDAAVIMNLMESEIMAAAASWTADGANNVKDGDVAGRPDVATAKADAATAYAASAATAEAGPQAMAWAGPGGQARVMRRRAKLTTTFLLAQSKKDVDFYAVAAANVAGSTSFNAYGDDVQDGLIHLFESQAALPAASTSCLSGLLGTLAQPTFGAATDGTRYGYYVSPDFASGGWGNGGVLVVDYLVTDGFQYNAGT